MEPAKSTFLSFKKSKIKILGINNVELYQCEKSQCKIRRILGYTKMKYQTKFQVFENVYCSTIQIHTLVIFAQPKIQQILHRDFAH